MDGEQISDVALEEMLDCRTLWLAETPGPRSFWSLRYALKWIAQQPNGAEFALRRPPDTTRCAPTYVAPEQIARLSF